MVMDILAKANGFKNETEMVMLMSYSDLRDKEDLDNFKKWQKEDGTKEGLLKLSGFVKSKKMEALYEAIKEGNEEEINNLACELFIKSGSSNFKQIKIFVERYPEVEVVCLERDGFGWLVGGIKLNGKLVGSYG